MRRASMVPVVLSAVLAACGGQSVRSAGDATPGDWTSYQSIEWGYAVSFPTGWHRAARPLRPDLFDPREILTLATFSTLKGTRSGIVCRSPSGLPEFSERDALVTLLEGGKGSLRINDASYPPRPDRFRPQRFPDGSTFTACFVRELPVTDHWFGFSDAGRAFHVLVVIGRSAPERVRRVAWRILDSLRLDPDIRPDWEASP